MISTVPISHRPPLCHEAATTLHRLVVLNCAARPPAEEYDSRFFLEAVASRWLHLFAMAVDKMFFQSMLNRYVFAAHECPEKETGHAAIPTPMAHKPDGMALQRRADSPKKRTPAKPARDRIKKTEV